MSTPRMVRSWLFSLLAVLFASAPLAAQQGTVSGVVRTEAGEPLVGAQVTVTGTSLGTLTQENGRYLLTQVPSGEQRIQAELIGYSTVIRTANVRPGETVTLDFTLTTEAVALREIVVTGVVGATERAKVPFTVDQLSSEDLPVPSVTPAQAIQGKVAGATVVSASGRPGSAPSILLRGPTSLNASGRDQEPLYIVDGVILGASIVDISGLDIDNIEVIKGAAAASLYGSRAANGVIQITTKRGRGMASGDIRYTLRTEYGKSDLPGAFPLSRQHRFELTADGSQFVDSSTGQACDWLDFGSVTGCTSPALAGQAAGTGTRNQWNTYQSQPWPGGARDQVDVFFEGGDFMENYVAASGRQGATNFHISFANTSNEGVMPGQEGLDRQSFRVNVDQTVRQNLQVSASASYSRTEASIGEGLLFDLTRMPAGVDLTACENNRTQSCLGNPDSLMLVPDPTNTESANPLYQMLLEQDVQDRGRFLGSANARLSVTDWLDLDANVSYDRLDAERENLYPKGFRTIGASSLNEGYLFQSDFLNEAINTSITATGRFQLGENISNRTQLRYLYEQDDETYNETTGYEFAVKNVPTFDNIGDLRAAESYQQSIRADGYFAITNFDIMDRYIVDALVRNDGSSLFGSEERRQWYYRFAGAWRMAQEAWFPAAGIDEFKLRYSYGTAGGRPRFEAQYETYSVSGGVVSPVTLGNVDLKPEFSREQEVGLDALFFDGRFGASLTYANTVTEDQILPVPAPAYTGFQSQWRNAGTLESNTWEASLDARLFRTDNMQWTTRLLFDRTRTTITELNVPPFQYGVGGQGLGTVFYAREGEEVGTFYGVRAATSCADLPQGVSCDGFINDENGFLVWVGDGSLDDAAWGTSSDVDIRGAPVSWGTPFVAECTDRTTTERTLFCPVGNSMPDYSVGLQNTFRWGGLTLYGLVDAVQGFEVYNQPLQWATFRRTSGIYDVADPSVDPSAKPLGYWDAFYAVSGLQPSTVFTEDASFVKLREVALSYRLGGEMLSRLGPLNQLQGVTLSVIGRNLKTWSDYRGYDPEVGAPGGNTGSAALARVDGYRYPNFRTVTFGVELNF